MSPLGGSLGRGYRAQGEKINIPGVLGEGKKDEGGGGEQTLEVLKGILMWVTSRGGEGCLRPPSGQQFQTVDSPGTPSCLLQKREKHTAHSRRPRDQGGCASSSPPSPACVRWRLSTSAANHEVNLPNDRRLESGHTHLPFHFRLSFCLPACLHH